MRLVRSAACALAATLALATAAAAFVDPGQSAPAFTKNVLGGSPATYSLSDFAGKVVVLAIIGYN